MATPQVVPPQQTLFSGINRPVQVPACSLTAEDLRFLYALLSQKADLAADLQIATLTKPQNQSQQDFDAMIRDLRELMKLTVRVQAMSGEWTGGQSDEALADRKLPAQIATVDFTSSLMYETRIKAAPDNWLSVHFDFSRPSVLDLSNLSISPAQNLSNGQVSGSNTTFVNACAEELRKYFDDRKTFRGWLHSRITYDALVIPFGFPLSFTAVAFGDSLLRKRVIGPESLFVAIDVYIALIALLAFRILFNYMRWAYPKLEGPSRVSAALAWHRGFAKLIVAGIVGTLIRVALHFIGVG